MADWIATSKSRPLQLLRRALGSLPYGPWWPGLDEVIETARTFYPAELRRGDGRHRMSLTVKPLTLERWPAGGFFGRAGASNGCWCMYWRIGPRYRDRPRADNRDDLRQLAASDQPPGLLAFDGELAVGWCELAPRATWPG